MKVRYKSYEEIDSLVRSFEEATISREDWRHAEHMVVALHYLSLNDFETAARKMREGIFALLRAFKVDMTKEMPYHETLTMFWMRTVEDFSQSRDDLSILEKANSLVKTFDKDYPLRFYSRKVLFSDHARAEYVPGDLVSELPAESLEQTA